MTAAAAARLPAMSPAQLKASLWADERQQVYAIVMGSRVPDLPDRLAAADLPDHDCLLPGALEPGERLRAPWIAQLQPQSPFTDWLLFEAAGALGDWGLLAASPSPLLALRNHLREHRHARLPGGEEITLDWMDPELFAALLEHADAAALPALFGPVSRYTQPGPALWRHASLVMGALQRQDAPLARAAGAA